MLYYMRSLLGAVAPLAVSIPTLAAGVGSSAIVVSNPTSPATVTGGVGPYSYAWSVSAQTGNKTVTITSPSASSTTFRVSTLVAGDSGYCDAICTVTDTATQVAVSNICSVQLDRT